MIPLYFDVFYTKILVCCLNISKFRYEISLSWHFQHDLHQQDMKSLIKIYMDQVNSMVLVHKHLDRINPTLHHYTYFHQKLFPCNQIQVLTLYDSSDKKKYYILIANDPPYVVYYNFITLKCHVIYQHDPINMTISTYI